MPDPTLALLRLQPALHTHGTPIQCTGLFRSEGLIIQWGTMLLSIALAID
jgi:hypothetical protein